jgi:RNA polymerase sigma-70 factor (ECF subfamily)
MTTVEAVWDSLNGKLSRFIRSRIDDDAAADDVLQEVYLKIHLNLDSVRAHDRIESWVYQIARNAVHDYYRQRVPTAEIGEDIAVAEADDADDEIVRRLASSVRSMIDLMPDDYREALILTEYDGLTQAQLAQRLGISLSGAKSRVQRGRKMLREMLLACCHFQFDRLGKVLDYYPRCQCCAEGRCER